MEIIAQTILIWSILYVVTRTIYLILWKIRHNWTLSKQREREIERFISRLENSNGR